MTTRKPIQPWAMHIVHDGPVEHWRVTALLAKSAKRMWDALVAMPLEEREKLPFDVQKAIPDLYRQLELTDYFLSGMGEDDVSR